MDACLFERLVNRVRPEVTQAETARFGRDLPHEDRLARCHVEPHHIISAASLRLVQKLGNQDDPDPLALRQSVAPEVRLDVERSRLGRIDFDRIPVHLVDPSADRIEVHRRGGRTAYPVVGVLVGLVEQQVVDLAKGLDELFGRFGGAPDLHRRIVHAVDVDLFAAGEPVLGVRNQANRAEGQTEKEFFHVVNIF